MGLKFIKISFTIDASTLDIDKLGTIPIMLCG